MFYKALPITTNMSQYAFTCQFNSIKKVNNLMMVSYPLVNQCVS